MAIQLRKELNHLFIAEPKITEAEDYISFCVSLSFDVVVWQFRGECGPLSPLSSCCTSTPFLSTHTHTPVLILTPFLLLIESSLSHVFLSFELML